MGTAILERENVRECVEGGGRYNLRTIPTINHSLFEQPCQLSSSGRFDIETRTMVS